MTLSEHDWFYENDPLRLLDFLVRRVTGLHPDWPHLTHMTDRHARLITNAYFRSLWSRHVDWESVLAGCSWSEKIAECRIAYKDVPGPGTGWLSCASEGRRGIDFVYYHFRGQQGQGAWMSAILLNILRDIVGNPYRPLTYSTHPDEEEGGWWRSEPEQVGMERQFVPPSVLLWQDGQVGRLAQAAWESRTDDHILDPAQLGILADALEDAGCEESDIVNHLRERPPGVPTKCSCGRHWEPLHKKTTPRTSFCSVCCKEGPFWADILQEFRARHHPGCWVIDMLRPLENCPWKRSA